MAMHRRGSVVTYVREYVEVESESDSKRRKKAEERLLNRAGFTLSEWTRPRSTCSKRKDEEGIRVWRNPLPCDSLIPPSALRQVNTDAGHYRLRHHFLPLLLPHESISSLCLSLRFALRRPTAACRSPSPPSPIFSLFSFKPDTTTTCRPSPPTSSLLPPISSLHREPVAIISSSSPFSDGHRRCHGATTIKGDDHRGIPASPTTSAITVSVFQRRTVAGQTVGIYILYIHLQGTPLVMEEEATIEAGGGT
ncbi:uncharacterized protein LOC127791666 [Diospyros lotus]|uniref:uncharacterized protein LOC127791666 n=1 Tax=Diospyros lotus TaxID=55363 RepID=UPI0022551FC6|nr:uncharacterized protein LOC127791666 [Diospyros lotus]